MRRLLIPIAVLLLVASACGDDDAFDLGSSTTTTEATSTTSGDTAESSTTAATTTIPEADGVGAGEARDDKRDPGAVAIQSLSKAGGDVRTDGGGGGGDAAPAPSSPPMNRGDDPLLDGMWEDCAAGDMQACDDLWRASPIGSEYEEFADTCGNTTAGGTWCADTDENDPFSYGDDPDLDVMWDDCSAGDWAACDALYMDSPVGSAYEAYGLLCGGTTDGRDWCVDAYIGDEPFAYGDDPYLDGLWDDCAAGIWAACDDLFSSSPVGSEYEDFGFTCGGLTDGSRWCVDEFGEGTFTYGDDPYLDGLWDDCAAGDMAACDTLWRESPVGSEYESFADTCGNRTAGGTWCAGTDTGEPWSYGDDAYFDGLWDDCSAGDWAACDTLYSESPIGSDYEFFGETCGGLTDGQLWCVDEFGGEAYTYGDDAYLDGLWDDCAAGDWAACDDLYLESPIGSEYESFGETCGGLTDGSELCTTAFGGEAYTYGDDAYFDGLWDDCAAGDMAACDDLYWESPVGSEYEEFGGTCGGTGSGYGSCDTGLGGEPYTYGDDAYFDGLWDDCAAGDMVACDDLYWESPVGSEYEEFGGTCGGTGSAYGSCAGDTGGDAYTYGDDTYMDGLWDACAGEDWAACDELYQVSPIGSEYETFGDTCGYRTDGGVWCVDAFGGGGDTGGDAYTYGDDTYMDGLWDACAFEDWAACDELYQVSPIGSEYETFGDTCGYRTDGGVWCVDFYG